MADIQHKNIVDPNIHEPKGVKFAAKDTAYIADGNGSGAWREVLMPGFSVSTESLIVTLSGSMNGPGLVNSGVYPVGFQAIENNAPSIGVYSNYLNITESGVYLIIPEITINLFDTLGRTDLYYSVNLNTSFSKSTASKVVVSPIAPTVNVTLNNPAQAAGGQIIKMLAISLTAGDNLCLWKGGTHQGSEYVGSSISGNIQIIKFP
jgi:hypothetical protein